MDYFQLLTDCGLSKKEASVYLELLEGGPMTLSKISHHTHINRPALYTLLPKMTDQGLVSYVKQNKRSMYAAEPVERVEQQFKKRHASVKDGLAALKNEFKKANSNKPVVKYFEGKKGLDHVYEDIGITLPKGGVFYRYTARMGPKRKEYTRLAYDKLKETKAFERYAITSEDKAAKKKPKLNRHVRAIPKEFDLFEDDISLLIYSDKTAYIDYGSKTAFIVESQKIAHFQEKLFKLLWEKLKK